MTYGAYIAHPKRARFEKKITTVKISLSIYVEVIYRCLHTYTLKTEVLKYILKCHF